MEKEAGRPVVLICGPDRRDPACRTFLLEEHEHCVGHLEHHYVFAVPESAKLLDGLDVIAKFSLEETAVICHKLLSRQFVFLSRSSAKGLPDEGFMIDYDSWLSVKNSEEGRNSFYRGLHRADLCRALRIHVAELEPGFEVSPVLVEASQLATHQNRLFRVGSWPRKMWEQSADLIPAEEIERMEIRETMEGPRHFPKLAFQIEPEDKERFLLCHLFRHWEEQNTPLRIRSRDFAEVTGRKIESSKGNFRNLLVRAGCLNPSPSLRKPAYDSVRDEARKFLKQADAERLHEVLAGLSIESVEFAKLLLAVIFPVEFGDALKDYPLARPVWSFVPSAGLQVPPSE